MLNLDEDLQTVVFLLPHPQLSHVQFVSGTSLNLQYSTDEL